MPTDITAIRNVRGFLAAGLVNSESGMILASQSGSDGFDIDAAAAAHVEVVRAKAAAMRALGVKHRIDDILITLGGQHHLIRPLARNRDVFLFVALDRPGASLGETRLAVKRIEAAIAV